MSSSIYDQNQSQRIPLHSIRQYYAPPGIDTSSRKKSHTGITIRKNKQSVSTAEGSSSYLNHTESSQSNKVGSISSMIPCFPANNGTGVHHCDNALNRSLSSHDTKDCPFNTSQDSTRPTTNDLCHCLENHKGYYLRNSDRKECSCCSLSLRMNNQFQECFYVRK